jgi:hypothetical protein
MPTAFHLELLCHRSNQSMGHRQQVIHSPGRLQLALTRHLDRVITLLHPTNLALRMEHLEDLNRILLCNRLMELLKGLSRMVLQLLLVILQSQMRSPVRPMVTLQPVILLQDRHRLTRMDNIVHPVRLSNSIQDMSNHATQRTSHHLKTLCLGRLFKPHLFKN